MEKLQQSLRIACAGDNCVDYYTQTGEKFYGGNPVNVSVYLAELGAKSSYLGAVGTDSLGQGMIAALNKKKVDLSHVQILEGKTAVTYVTLNNGDRVLGDYDEGVMAEFSLREEDFPFIAEHHLFISGLWGHTENHLERVWQLGIPVAFDFADQIERDTAVTAAAHTDIAFFSDDTNELETLKTKMIQFSRLGPAYVIATRGKEGSIAYHKGKFTEYGIVPCKVVDTMGAGDSYIAGFLYAWLQKNSLRDCMAAGATKSAETLGYQAAW